VTVTKQPIDERRNLKRAVKWFHRPYVILADSVMLLRYPDLVEIQKKSYDRFLQVDYSTDQEKEQWS